MSATEKPSISVIIPTYNHGAFIERSISSVLAQTIDDYEIIVVDDGSTDDTAERMKPLRNQVLYHYQENRGLGGARNIGLALARGKYVQFLDADDSIAPQKFEKQVPILESDESVDIVYSGFVSINGHHEPFDGVSQPLATGESPLRHLIRENFMPVHAPLVRRDVFDKEGGFDESRVAQEDWDVWLRLASRGYKFSYVPGVFAFYHRDGCTMTSNPNLMYQRGLHLLGKFMADPVFRGLGNDLVQEFSYHQHLALAARCYNNGQWAKARRHLLHGLYARPRLIKPQACLLVMKTLAHQVWDPLNRSKPERRVV